MGQIRLDLFDALVGDRPVSAMWQRPADLQVIGVGVVDQYRSAAATEDLHLAGEPAGMRQPEPKDVLIEDVEPAVVDAGEPPDLGVAAIGADDPARPDGVLTVAAGGRPATWSRP